MAKNIDELLKKKSTKPTNDAPKQQTDMKTRMQNVVNASKRLAENNEEQKDRNEDLKARLNRAMEASNRMEAEFADEYAEEEKARKKADAQKEARKKKLEEQQRKALEKLAAIEAGEKLEKLDKDEKKSTKKASTSKKETAPKPIIKEVIKEVPVEVIKEVKVEVPVEKIVEKKVEVPVIKEVIKEVKVEVPVEKIVEKEVIKKVEVPVVKEVIKKVEVPVEKIVEKKVEVPVVKEVIKEVKVEVPVVKEVVKEVPVEKVVEKEVIKEVPVDRIIEKKVEVPVVKEVIKEVPVEKIIEKEVVKEVPVEKVVEKEVVKEVPIVREVIKEVPVDRIIKQEVVKEVPVIKEVVKEVKVEVPIVQEKVKEVPVETRTVEEAKPEKKEKEEKKEKPVLNFFMKTMNGMALGLFATLIIGTILDTVALIPFIKNTEAIYNFITQLAKVLQYSMGIGIGVGVALNMGFKDIKLICVGLAGGIASYMCGKSLEFFNFDNLGFKVGDPLTVYITVVITGLLMKLIFKKKTSVDIIIVPLFASIVAGLIAFTSSPAIVFVTTAIGDFIELATQLHPFVMGIIIAVIMGMALTAPISSAAIGAVVLLEAPLAGGAAIVGCCVQMIGFAVQTARDNKIGSVISVAIGTSMLQFKNILKKPVIWLPTIIASAILGPIATCVFSTNCLGVNAGMGTSGLVGVIGTYNAMATNGVDTWKIIASIAGLEIVAPIVLVFVIDALFRKIGWIKKGDLEL